MTVLQNVEYGLRVQGCRPAESPCQGRRGAGDRAAGGLRRPPAEPAVRRPAPAGRAGPGAGEPAEGAAARRAARRARPEAAREMQVELKAIQREVGITFVFVTHDQEEALTMSDRIAVFNGGRIEQVGSAGRGVRAPGHARSSPGFVGTSNLLEGDGRASACSATAGLVHACARRRSGCTPRRRRPPDRGCVRRPAVVARGRLRRLGHPLRGRPRRRRPARSCCSRTSRAPRARTGSTAGCPGPADLAPRAHRRDRRSPTRRRTGVRRRPPSAYRPWNSRHEQGRCPMTRLQRGGEPGTARAAGDRVRHVGGDGDSGDARPGRSGFTARTLEEARHARRRRGPAQHPRLGRVRRGRLERPEASTGSRRSRSRPAAR